MDYSVMLHKTSQLKNKIKGEIQIYTRIAQKRIRINITEKEKKN